VYGRLALLGFLIIIPLLSACGGPYSTLDPAGPSAESAARLWWGMFTFASLVLLIVVVLWLHAMRRDPGNASERDARRIQNRWIIGGGLVLPLTSIAVLLAFGIPAGHRMLPLPLDEGEAVRIDVTAHQWWWEVSYPGTDVTLRDEIHMPVGVPVDFHVRSADVIHSFWIPRLGGKLDMIPGRTGVLRLHADEPGIYRGLCAEFCGTGHAHMRFTVQAHSTEDFDAWLEAQRNE